MAKAPCGKHFSWGTLFDCVGKDNRMCDRCPLKHKIK